jgi:hypothetical protein
MSKYRIPKQRSLMPNLVPDKVFGDVRQNLLQLKYKHGNDIFKEDKKLALEYWLEFDGLREVLARADVKEYIRWFLIDATEYESISRSSRKLKEEGIVPRSKVAMDRAGEFARYWGSQTKQN